MMLEVLEGVWRRRTPRHSHDRGQTKTQFEREYQLWHYRWFLDIIEVNISSTILCLLTEFPLVVGQRSIIMEERRTSFIQSLADIDVLDGSTT